MIVYRIKHKGIVSEVYLPASRNGKVIILLGGLPSFLYKNKLTMSLVEDGFTVLQPFYSGSFDSDGNFLPAECVNDVSVFLEIAKKGKFKELYYGKEISFSVNEVFIFGVSYGSSIACLASGIKGISKIVLISPVLTYKESLISDMGFNGKEFGKSMDSLVGLLKNAYSYTYRIKNINLWNSFLHGKDDSLDPLRSLAKINLPIMALCGENDESYPSSLLKKIVEHKLDKKLRLEIIKDAGHGLSSFCNPEVLSIIYSFLSNDHELQT
jgi:pimeloyl-ACP methyl ester carboxylesterase